jgi:hypothetical protein
MLTLREGRKTEQQSLAKGVWAFWLVMLCAWRANSLARRQFRVRQHLLQIVRDFPLKSN